MHAQKMVATGRLHEGKVPMQQIGVKEGGGHLLEGDRISGAYGIYILYP